MNFIKIPLCGCTNDRCKKKPPTVGSYANQSVQTDIRFGFDRKRTFSSVELGKGEVSAKHSISTSMDVELIISGRLRTSFDSKSHESYPLSNPIIKEVGDGKKKSRAELGQDLESEYLPSAYIQESLLNPSFEQMKPAEKDELYSEDPDLSMLDEEQRDLGAWADSRADPNYDVADAKEESRYDLEVKAEVPTYHVEETEEESTYDLEEIGEELTYGLKEKREETLYDLEETMEKSTYNRGGTREKSAHDMEDTIEESTYDIKDIREDGSASIIESPLAALDQKLDPVREVSAYSNTTVSSDDPIQKVPTMFPLPSSISVQPDEQVAETQNFSELKESDPKPKETRPKSKKKRRIRPVRSGLTATPNPGKFKIFQSKVHQPRKKLTPPKRVAHIPIPLWPATAQLSQSIRCCSNELLGTCRVSNSVCSQSVRLAQSRVSHSIQCDFGSYRVNPCDRTGRGRHIQQYCNEFCKNTDDISCYKLQAPPNHNHLSQSCEAFPKPPETCNLYRMQVSNPPQIQPWLQPWQHRPSGFKNWQNTPNCRKSFKPDCGNAHFRKYCGCSNLHGMFTPYRTCYSYRHTMVHPSMYLYTFAT